MLNVRTIIILDVKLAEPTLERYKTVWHFTSNAYPSNVKTILLTYFRLDNIIKRYRTRRYGLINERTSRIINNYIL